MTLRIRTEVAWLLRGIAKALNARADAMDPIKLMPAPIANVTFVEMSARAAIERASRQKPLPTIRHGAGR